ncbi:DNRLRE domain-containing protein [Paenibacillus azoreducens]|uniref:CBM96 family carbohydrate-binding protein n=1 Tax=Paenibacillus azoreducens TaxID=116718 RepID=UPI0039F54BF1
MSGNIRKSKFLSSKIGLGLLTLILTAVIFPTLTSASPVTLSPMDDSYVHQGNPSANYGTSASLYVKNDVANARQTYLKFNLSEFSNVTDAKLRIYGSSSYNTVLSAYETADNWSEGSITWNNKPAQGSLAGSVPMNTAPAYYELDVTSYVAAEAAGDGIISFMLQESAGKYTTLNSKEKGTNAPELIVTSSGTNPGGDHQPPTVPTNVKAVAISGTQIKLSWSPSTDNVGVTGYEVFRNGVLAAETPGTFLNDKDLNPDTTYSYYVTAKDAAGNRSAPSSTVMVKTLSDSGPAPVCTNALNSAAAIQNAMKNAAPGDVISIAAGTYTGVRSASGDPGGQGLFYSGKNGTAANPIIMKSCDPAHPAVLKGINANDGSYGIHLTGDYWQIRDLEIDTAQKGIVVDHGNHNLLHGLKVHNIGDEGVHFRDGSSYNTLEYSTIYDTGKYQPGFGEGAYVGSDSSSNYEHLVYDNVISHTVFDGGITAEHVDVKEGASGTIIEYCTFNGTGISGENSADSFIDIKGVNTIVRHNQGYRNGNVNIKDAFQVRTHGTAYPTGTNNSFDHNTVNLDDSAGYVVYATSAATGTTAHDDVRIGGGNLYNNNVNK